MDQLIIIGIGNPFRGDDRVGWAVIERLSQESERLPLDKTRGDVGELVEILGSHKKSVFFLERKDSIAKEFKEKLKPFRAFNRKLRLKVNNKFYKIDLSNEVKEFFNNYYKKNKS